MQALDRRVVLGMDAAPQRGELFDRRGVGHIVAQMVDDAPLARAIGRLGQAEMNAELVGSVVPEDEVGEQREIERAHVERVRQHRTPRVGALGRYVDGAAEAGAVVDHVVLAQGPAGRRVRVHHGHVVGLDDAPDQESWGWAPVRPMI